MQRVLRHRLLPALSAFLSLVALAILPFGGVASAAPKSTICQNGDGLNCFLEISAPESVAVGQPFTVTVTLWEYGFGDNPAIPLPKSDLCSSKTGVSLDVFQGEGPVTTYFANARGGVATFNISLPTDDGSWTLDAYVDHPEGSSNCGYFDDGFADVTAVDVPADQPIAACPDHVVCVQTTSGTGSAATLFADTGSFPSAFFEAYDGQGCGAPADSGNGVLDFSYVGSSDKTIVYALSPSLITKGIGQFNVCWESTNPFTVEGGGAAVLNASTGLYVGSLPMCSPHAGAPCVLYKTSDQHNAGFFGVLAPPSDPKGYPY